MSWLEDFSDGEAVWQRLMSAPRFNDFLVTARQLSDWELRKVVLYLGIAAKQADGEWREWSKEEEGPG
jgi:hypothetical protein